MSTSMRPMSPTEQAEQAVHDRRHPGLICQTCPVEVAHARWLADRHDWYMRRFARARRRRLLVALACLAAFLWGWLAPWPHFS